MYHYIIIDDETPTREGTIAKLSPLHEQIACIGQADDGADGLLMIDRFHPDIVITDMKMPVLGGEKLLPILAEKYPDISIIAISGYQDYEYLRNAIRANVIDYVVKPFSADEIISAMHRAISRIEDRNMEEQRKKITEESFEYAQLAYDKELLRNMIAGYADSTSQLSSRKLNFLCQSRPYLLITLYSETPLPESEIQTFLTDNSYDNFLLYLSHMQEENIGFLILSLPPQDMASPFPYCQKIIRSLSSLFWKTCLQVLYGVSNVHHELNELHLAYLENIQVLNQVDIHTKEGHFFYRADIPAPRQITWPQTENLLFCIEAGRDDEAAFLVNSLFNYYETLQDISLYEVKHNCFYITNRVKSVMDSYISSVQNMSADAGIQNILDTIFSFSNLKAYYLQYFRNITLNLKKDSVYSDTDLVNNAKIYIERNYQKNISVEFVASLLHMNRSYLSHIFKKKFNKSFIDYLNEVRISHSKELLDHTDKKMYQIAKLVGYNNVRYFFHAFKKLEGITPDQYRKAFEK
jgi:two-component system response regulator YesN